MPQAASDAEIGESCYERFWLRLKTNKSRTPCAKIFDDECLIVSYLFGQCIFIFLYLNMWLHWIGLFLRNTNDAVNRMTYSVMTYTSVYQVIQYDVYNADENKESQRLQHLSNVYKIFKTHCPNHDIFQFLEDDDL